MVENLDLYTLLMTMANRLGIDAKDGVVYKALKLIEKGIPVTHILAEVLIYSYIKSKDYSYVSIEETVGATKCDVYAERGSESVCVEIETYSVPIEYVIESQHYIVARHVKKILQVAKEGKNMLVFAYPYGMVPLIPSEILKGTEERSEEELAKLIAVARKFYNIDYDAIAYLKNYSIKYVYIYSLTLLKVVQLAVDNLLKIIDTYNKLIPVH